MVKRQIVALKDVSLILSYNPNNIMEKEIVDFIKRRFSINCNWLNGNCLWFAFILKKRFPNLNIYYLPIEGHFIVGYLGEYFDWTGKIELKECPILFDEIRENDKNWYERLIRDCFM